MHWNEQFIKDAVPEVTILHATFPQQVTVSIDSRTLNEGDIFIALKGSSTDGHNFIQEAVARKAAGLIIEHDKQEYLQQCDPNLLKKMLVVTVPDTYQALIKLASSWRAQFDYPVVAITGSVGKTTTKELISKILRVHGVSHCVSVGNKNSIIGLALSLLSMRPEHKVAIVECGISRRGEMTQLAAMAKPTYAVITCIAHAHMEGLGSLTNIAVEKREIFSQFTERNVGFINGDQALLAGVGYRHPMIKFGTKTTNQIQARKLAIHDGNIDLVLKIYGVKYKITLPTNHQAAVYNTLAAVAVTYLLQVPTETILKAIQMPITVPGRFQSCALKAKPGIIIDDCYNANPESMKAALLAFEALQTKGPKIAILGDMLELGIASPFWHRQIGRFLRKTPSVKQLVLVGDLVKWTKKTAPFGLAIEHVRTWQEAKELLEKDTTDEPVILVKGSYGVGLQNLVKALT